MSFWDEKEAKRLSHKLSCYNILVYVLCILKT